MKKLASKHMLEFMMMQSFIEVRRHQKYIDEWNDPRDIVQRAAVLIRDVHNLYGALACVIYADMEYKIK